MPTRRTGSLLLLLAGLASGRAQAPDTLLTSAAQIRQLSPEAAARAIPARVTGIVTYYDEPHNLAFVQDVTAGTYVDPGWRNIEPAAFAGPVEAGLQVELTGRTREGRFAPFLSQHLTARILGKADKFPEPLRPMRRLLLDPTFHSQWVEVEAFVREVDRDEGRLRLHLAVGPRDFDAYVTGDWSNRPPPENLLKSDIRVRGVYGSIFNDRRQLVGLRLFVPSLEQILVLDPGMANAFSQPPRRINEIMQFNPHVSERIHLRGVVLAHLADQGFYLRGEDGALWVETTHAERLPPGQRVDVVGFPRAGELRPLLLDAVVKPQSRGPAPEPLHVPADEVLEQPVDAELIRLEARLIDHLERPGNSLLLLQAGRHTFPVRLLSDEALPRDLAVGSWVAVTGICVMQGETTATAIDAAEDLPIADPRVTGFSLVLRTLADVEVLQSPPWWTPGRVRIVLGGLLAVTGAILLWGALLRRRVSEQTALIKNQIEREHVAEERARIARELHDTLEQQLVGITMQLDTAASRLDTSPQKARRSLDLARAMLRRSQSDARQSVWDLRAAELTQTRLDHALRDLVEPLHHAGQATIRVTTSGTYPTRLDGVAKNHVLRIAQESVTNALKHANARTIDVTLDAAPDHLGLTVSDDGIGFEENVHPGAHFGLLGLRERAGKLHADLRIESRPGRGTRISLHVPQPT